MIRDPVEIEIDIGNKEKTPVEFDTRNQETIE